ncbi:MAG: hypothetical protein DME10_13945 [Candidatus Rokuibacteriota bacterium]|nr:MAG: hypothetical protein DME10_13945 [Candidatus Rokubacteria bacterium]
MAKGGHDTEGCEEAGQIVGIDGRGPGRRPVGGAVEVPRAAERGGDGREARALAERPRLAEGGDARHDERGAELAQVLPAQPPRLQHAGPEIFEHDVAEGDEATHDVLPLRRVEVERHHFLAPVVDGVPVVEAILGGSEPSEIVTLARQLCLDHLGAEFGHERAAEGASHDLCQLEDADAGQGQGAVGHGERAAL